MQSEGERVAGKHLAEIREPGGESVPARGRGERRALVRRGDEEDPAENDARSDARALLGERAEDEAAPGMRDRVEKHGPARQARAEVPGIRVRRGSHREVVEREDTAVVAALKRREKPWIGREVPERRGRVRERAVHEEEAPRGRRREREVPDTRGDETAVPGRERHEAERRLRGEEAFLLPEAREDRKQRARRRAQDPQEEDADRGADPAPPG